MPVFDAVTIVARSLADSLAFYRLMGVEPEKPPIGHYAATELDCGVRLEWTVESSSRATASQQVRLGVRCADSDELERTYRTIVAAGHRTVSAPHDATWGARVCRVLDPDGNAVELYTPWP
jgi:catechol 2,3-dioxygenase-like lactoylglutathione lyase family enzyme